MHATEFLHQKPELQHPCLIVLHGNERHLKTESLAKLCEATLGGSPDEALGLTRFTGKECEFKSVRDELLTVSMFSRQKLVLVEDADDFVTQFRGQLENYAEKPARNGLLVLDVKTWKKNTRLAKKTDAAGLAIDCSELTGAALSSWLVQQARQLHEKQLSREAATLMTELAGGGMGLLSQELSKLAAYCGEQEKIGVEEVRKLVGGWKAETTWTMIDAVRDGRPGLALACLNKLFYAGEPALKILGGINYVFRKYALAVENSRMGRPLKEALHEAGVFPRDVAAAEQYLRRIRRGRAERILEMLARTDYELKGASRLPDQMQLERLILWLAGVGLEQRTVPVPARH